MNMAAIYTGHTDKHVLDVYREIQCFTDDHTHASEINLLQNRANLLVMQSQCCIDPQVGEKLMTIANTYMREIARLNKENTRVQYHGRVHL